MKEERKIRNKGIKEGMKQESMGGRAREKKGRKKGKKGGRNERMEKGKKGRRKKGASSHPPWTILHDRWVPSRATVIFLQLNYFNHVLV